MQRIIVTGATSMIGVALIEECIKHGTEVYAVVREGSKKRSRLPESSLIKFADCSLDGCGSLSKLYREQGKKQDCCHHKEHRADHARKAPSSSVLPAFYSHIQLLLTDCRKHAYQRQHHGKQHQSH